MTVAAVQPVPRYASPPTPRIRRFTVDEYHRLIEDGYFAHDERFELLEGWIVAKVSRNPVHDAALSIAKKVLDRAVPVGWHVRVQSGFTTTDSEPEPDLAIVRGDERDYVARHPGPADTALLVEVANTSLPEDREIKARIYAGAGVPAYWIVNLNDRAVEVYTDPSGAAPSAAYATRKDYRAGDALRLSIPSTTDVNLAVVDMLP